MPLHPKVGVIALVPDVWEAHFQARHHVLSRLARFFHVVWINPAPSWRGAVPTLITGRKLWHDPNQLPGFHVYTPETLLVNFGRPRWLADVTLRKRLQHGVEILKNQKCTRIVLYLWRPHFADALRLIDHDLSCYHIDDEYSFSTVERTTAPKEETLIRTVGQVFVHSPAMMEKKGSLNPNTQLIPNGVDYNLFAQPLAEPDDLRDIPHPRIGYTGVLKRMLDWELIDKLTRRHPEWSFVFVGPVAHAEVKALTAKLSTRPNVHVLPGRSATELAHFPQHFDVCIMPYRLDDYTKYIYPLKLHEYLASGVPAVASPIRSLKEFGDVVILAEGEEQWSSALQRALSSAENSAAPRNSRQRTAQAYDWQVIVERIADTMLSRLNEPNDAISPSNSATCAECDLPIELPGRK